MRLNRFFLSGCGTALLLFFGVVTMQAQFDNGSVVGTIHDATGAVLPGASVTITNVATGQVTKATTNASGDYEAPSLHVGVYTIKAADAGYTDAVANNITISVGGRQRIDLEMKVGEAATTVEVTGV